MNSVFEKMLGYSEDELVGKKFQDISRSNRTRGDVIEAINDQLRNGKVIGKSLHNGHDFTGVTPLKTRCVTVKCG